jgi:hypothetical protein
MRKFRCAISQKKMLLFCISQAQESCSVVAGVMEKTKRQCIADHGIRIRTAFDSPSGATDARTGVGYNYYVATHRNATPNCRDTIKIKIT